MSCGARGPFQDSYAGRGAYGKPWLLGQVMHALRTGGGVVINPVSIAV